MACNHILRHQLIRIFQSIFNLRFDRNLSFSNAVSSGRSASRPGPAWLLEAATAWPHGHAESLSTLFGLSLSTLDLTVDLESSAPPSSLGVGPPPPARGPSTQFKSESERKWTWPSRPLSREFRATKKKQLL